MTLLMMMHHNTKFGNKLFGCLEDIIPTNSDIWPFIAAVILNELIHIFSHKTQWLMMMYHQTKFCCGRINSSEEKVERNCHILIIQALAVTLTLKTVNQFFCMTLWLMMLHHHTKFGNKMFCSSEDIIWTKIHWHFEPLL